MTRSKSIDSVDVFDPIVHLSTKASSHAREITPWTLNLPNARLLNQLAFPIFTTSCCEIIKDELLHYHLDEENIVRLVGPTVDASKSLLPFTYQALTNSKTLAIIEAMTGFDVELCTDSFEISQFAKNNIKEQHQQQTQESYMCMNWRKLPYVFVCLIQLHETGKSADDIPIGTATILDGKPTGNLSVQQLQNAGDSETDYRLNLILTLKPANLVEFENLKFDQTLQIEKLLQITYYHDENSISEESGLQRKQQQQQQQQDIYDCAAWLDKHYDNLLSK